MYRICLIVQPMNLTRKPTHVHLIYTKPVSTQLKCQTTCRQGPTLNEQQDIRQTTSLQLNNTHIWVNNVIFRTAWKKKKTVLMCWRVRRRTLVWDICFSPFLSAGRLFFWLKSLIPRNKLKMRSRTSTHASTATTA